ncbi:MULTISPECIES: MCE family protein [unclassified Mycobacterium]|uniref:MCE family protein n=1 Tax=unclassified Mycobacterium TaxID=2642494 RepID=UPI00074010F7|nr:MULTISPECIES: MCE family protein [unclassified Mycobacterium]KUH83137.1 mammalian cell entry protein [Mycobacterium sp. GA-0227b]KUH84453.1 mammalian cell entry protein [Mycobacterium sp. GA-1999]KUH89411.1 mammalian cell entry protein [Mycobacterium sp. IS-1556]
MNRSAHWRRVGAGLLAALAVTVLSGCGFLRDWRGANSLPLPGTEGGGPGSYTVRAQLPDVQNLDRNSRVRVNDVTVGNVEKIERQGWHALVTMTIDGDIDLPANATATVGQTSLLGSLHVELAPPTDVPPEGTLDDGALIPLSSGATFPSTEQTLAALSLLLNGGGLGQIQDITKALSTALSGREQDLRSLIGQLDQFVAYLNDQKGDIIAATESINNLVGQFAEQKPVVDRALKTLPDALTVLKDQRQNLAEALDQLGQFGALATDSVNLTKENLVKELNDLGPVLQSLADAGPALTRSLDFYATLPFPKPTLSKWLRGDYANLTAVVDLTLSRLDSSFLTGTFLEGELTELELQWGRTIGQMPSPYTARNPLIAPYHFNQGP